MNNPLRQSLVANSVPRERLMNAIALNSMAFNSMRMIGPGIGGGMIALLGPEVNFLLQAVVYGAVVLLVLPFRAEYAEGREGRKQQSPFADLKEGLRYVLREPILRYAILLSVVPTLTMMAFIQTQMPVFVAEDLGDSEGALLGFMYVGMGVGGFFGAVLVARFHAVQHKGRLSLMGVAGAGIAVLALSQTDVWWVAWWILVVQPAVLHHGDDHQQQHPADGHTGLHAGARDGHLHGGHRASAVRRSRSRVHRGEFGVSVAWLLGGAVGMVLVILITVAAPSFRRLRL